MITWSIKEICRLIASSYSAFWTLSRFCISVSVSLAWRIVSSRCWFCSYNNTDVSSTYCDETVIGATCQQHARIQCKLSSRPFIAQCSDTILLRRSILGDYTLSLDTRNSIHWTVLLRFEKASRRFLRPWCLLGLCIWSKLRPQRCCALCTRPEGKVR